jgi:hypothetical protein
MKGLGESAHMTKLHQSPVVWLVLLIIASFFLKFFWGYPHLATSLIGALAFVVIFGLIRASLRFRRLGYRIVPGGRDTFYYEEKSGGELRRLELYCELQARGPRLLYFPSVNQWQQEMPGWAKGRREEIYDRIRGSLGTKNVRYIEKQSHFA